MQKGSAQLLIILASLLIIAGGIYFYQTTKTSGSATNSKIVSPLQQLTVKDYQNPGLGFSFQHDKDLTVTEDSEVAYNQRGNGDFRKNFKGYVGYEPEKFLGAMAVLDESNSYETNPFTVWVFSNDNNLSVDGWFDKYWYYPFLWGVFDYTSKGHIRLDAEATVSGEPAKYKIIAYQPGNPRFIYISKDQKMYLLRVIGDSGDKILSTIKFTN